MTGQKRVMAAKQLPVSRTGQPNPIDIHVGRRVRQRRTLLGLSQEKLGEAVGLTFQQIQKYERGANRISASRLYALSNVLDVSVPFFFEEMPAEISGESVPGLVEDKKEGPDPLAKRETLELVRAYYRIKSPSVRERLFKLVKCLPDA
jgi:transcriptional regulator with XRE-family HTH domain